MSCHSHVFLYELAEEEGWSALFYPFDSLEHGAGFNCVITRHEEVEETRVVIDILCLLLGRLRDEHPNPDVADKAVELLVLLGAKAATVR